MTTPLRNSSDPYLAAADHLVDKLLPMWKDSDNVWRAGWVLDTLIDYFVARGENGSVIERPLLPVSPTKKGDWWDDFAWVGIATLRAAELEIFPDHRNELVKAAINAWAYMHGPGWSKTPTDRAFPFTDLEGWENFDPSADRRIGAPNSWSKIRETWTHGEPSAQQVGERRPRYSPGGVWNAPIRDQDSPKVVSANPDCPPGRVALAPVQNTVTNGQELRKMGAEIDLHDEHHASIHGPVRLRGAEVEIGDLRAGASLILAALAASGTTTIHGAHHVHRGYENIQRKFLDLGARIERQAEGTEVTTS